MTTYEALIVSINSANLNANIENVRINEELVARSRAHEHDNDEIIKILTEILEVLKSDRE